MKNSKLGLTGLSPVNLWYYFIGDHEQIGAKMKEWYEEFDPEKVKDKGEERYINAKRRICLMQILVLRAHGILEPGCKGFRNPFDRRVRKPYVSRGRGV